MMMSLQLILLVIFGLSSSSFSALAFVLPPSLAGRRQGRRQLLPMIALETTTTTTTTTTVLQFAAADDDNDGWISLTDDDAVQKRICTAGEGDPPTSGQTVEIDYVGTLGKINWDVEGVIQCWLLTQQGLDELADKFRQEGIDSKKLMDPEYFTEDFVATTLGLSNKIQIKKIVMASKRLGKAVTETPPGTKFDSNKDRNDGEAYSFVLGKKKAIRAMEIAVASMKVGEHSEIKCRTDYAYGKEGLRKANGDIMVPEYSTLCFDIKLVKCT